LPEGKYDGKTFCQVMNYMLSSTNLLYGNFWGIYPDSDKDESENKPYYTLFDSDIIKRDGDSKGHYPDEKYTFDQDILHFKQNDKLRFLKDNSEQIIAAQSVQALINQEKHPLCIELHDVVKKGMDKVKNYKEEIFFRIFSDYKKSRIRFEYNEEKNKIFIHFHGGQNFGDFIYFHSDLLLKYIGEPNVCQSKLWKENCLSCYSLKDNQQYIELSDKVSFPEAKICQPSEIKGVFDEDVKRYISSGMSTSHMPYYGFDKNLPCVTSK
jgi:hypothetical protein